MVHAGQLTASVYNANKMTPQEYEALKESIHEHGFVEPVVVQKIGLRIIGGHHRVQAVKELSIEAGEAIPEIPCIVLDVDDATAKKLNLKLQHIHGAPDPRLLGELLVDIFDGHQVQAQDTLALGIQFDDALKYIRIAEPDFPIPPAPDPVRSFGRSITLSLEFENVETRDAIKKVLAERTVLLKKKSGDVIAELLSAKSKKTNGKHKAKPLKKAHARA